MCNIFLSQDTVDLGLDTHIFELQLALLPMACIKVLSWDES